jgi:hypothetical protein
MIMLNPQPGTVVFTGGEDGETDQDGKHFVYHIPRIR